MSRWDTLVPEGADDPPLPGSVRFDLEDPYENRAGPFWWVEGEAAPPNSWGDEGVASRTFLLRLGERCAPQTCRPDPLTPHRAADCAGTATRGARRTAVCSC